MNMSVPFNLVSIEFMYFLILMHKNKYLNNQKVDAHVLHDKSCEFFHIEYAFI